MDCYRAASQELKRRIEETNITAEQKRKEVRDRFPQLSLLEDEIREAGLALVKSRVMSGREDASARAETELVSLQKKKDAFLRQNGLYESYEGEVYYCPVCRDTGYLERDGRKVRCGCFEKIYIEILTGMQSDLDVTARFENFRLDLYPDAPDTQRYESADPPRLCMERIYRRCRSLVDHYPGGNDNNMLFIGKTGLGKTFLSQCIANAFLEKGIPAVYIKAGRMFSEITYYGSDPGKKENAEAMRNLVYDAEILLLDDLGAEKQTETRYADLLDLLDRRIYLHNKAGRVTVISTNLTPKALLSYYDERICSRLFGSFDLFRFLGDDIRLKLVKK